MPTIIRTPETHAVENRRNYNVNPRMENSIAGWAVSQGAVQTAAVGGTRLDFATGGSGAGFFYQSAIAPADSSAWVSSIEVTVPVGFPTVNNVYMLTHFYGGAGYALSRSASVTIAPGQTVTIATNIPGTTPVASGNEGVRSIMAASGAIPAGARLIVRRAMLEKAETPGTYFDGTTTAYGNVSFSWAGTANASASIESLTVPVVSITPTVVNGYRAEREARTIIHPILGRTNPDVTLRPASLRTGTLELLFRSEADAVSASANLAAGRLWQLESDERDVNMTFVTPEGERIGLELDDETRDAWRLTVPFQEVA